MTARSVYLDHAATTPIDAAVAAAMAECMQLSGAFANPSSTHAFGREAAARVSAARAQVAERIGAEPESIVFTSGATESDNLALRGAMAARRDRGAHLVTSITEHKAVLDTAKLLAERGASVTWLACDSDGRIDPAVLDDVLTDQTVLVSVMHVNNETGVVQDIAALGERCRARNVLFHTDAAQSVGKIPLAVNRIPVDIVSLTAHKLHGPKGVGALYVRPGVSLAPLQYGGEQERGLRPGTLPTHQVVGMGEAFARADPATDSAHLRVLRERLWEGLAKIDGVRRNGSATHSSPHVLNVAFPGVSGETLRLAIEEIAVSAGSACNAETLESSHVLTAMGLSDALAESSIRFSVGRDTTLAEIDYAVRRTTEAVNHLRGFASSAPSWCTS